jgi:hypothetical protein
MGTYTIFGLFNVTGGKGYLGIFNSTPGYANATGGVSGVGAYYTSTKQPLDTYPTVVAAPNFNVAVQNIPLRWGLKRGLVPFTSSS